MMMMAVCMFKAYNVSVWQKKRVFVHSPPPAEWILVNDNISVNCSLSGWVCHPVFRREESAMNESDSQCYQKRRMPLTNRPSAIKNTSATPVKIKVQFIYTNIYLTLHCMIKSTFTAKIKSHLFI